MFAKTMEANMRPCVCLARDLDIEGIKAIQGATNDVRERRRLTAIRLCNQGDKTHPPHHRGAVPICHNVDSPGVARLNLVNLTGLRFANLSVYNECIGNNQG